MESDTASNSKWSVGRSLRLLERMQPASGGFLEAIPLTSFVVMGLSTSGRSGNPVVQNGIRFILESVLDDGSWPIDTNLATWTTTLSVNAFKLLDQNKRILTGDGGDSCESKSIPKRRTTENFTTNQVVPVRIKRLTETSHC